MGNGPSLIGQRPLPMSRGLFLVWGKQNAMGNGLSLIRQRPFLMRNGPFLNGSNQTLIRNGLSLIRQRPFLMTNELLHMRQNLLLGFCAKNAIPAKQRNYVEMVYEVWFMVLSVAGSEKIRRDPQND